MIAIARHADNTTSKWDTLHTDYKAVIRDVREAIVSETGKEPLVVLVRVK